MAWFECLLVYKWKEGWK